MNLSLHIIMSRHIVSLRRLLLMAPWIALASCTAFPGATTDVSRDPRVAAYLEEPRQLVKPCELSPNGRTAVLVEHRTPSDRHEQKTQRQVLPAGTRVDLTRIHRIQGDGFVLFRATGRVFPEDHPEGLDFTYKWGYGGTSPQAPWEAPGQRLKKLLGLE